MYSLESNRLKQELHSKLQLARREGGRDAPVRRAADAAVRRLEIGLVQKIERFGAELQLARFREQRELLVQADIELEEAVAASDIAACVAPRIRVDAIRGRNEHRVLVQVVERGALTLRR